MHKDVHMRDGVAAESGEAWMQRTRLFQNWKAMKQEILQHKWLESEKAGHDVGWEKAATNWMIHHRAQFRAPEAATVATDR